MNTKLSHMSPAQAAQVVGVSRWTVMRAIKSQSLHAIRDNKNQWRISSADLDAWMSHSVQFDNAAPDVHTRELIAQLREKLASETSRADAAEADRDRWQAMAHKLVDRPRSWWPWSRTKHK